MSRSNTLNFGSAAEAAEILNSEPDISQEDLHSALINALKRIDKLEKEVKDLREDYSGFRNHYGFL